jgi:outer membrane protein assembly factor BamB
MAVFALVAFVAAQGMIRPPLYRAWTIIGGDNTEVHRVADGRLYYSSQMSVGAVDVASGRPIWKRQVRGGRGGAYLDGRELFTLRYEPKRAKLLAFGLKDGKSRSVVTLPEDTDAIAGDGRRLFVLLPGGEIRAVDPRSGRTMWSRKVVTSSAQRAGRLASLTYGYGKLFAGIDGPGFFCLDAASGKVLWKDNAQYGVYNAPIPLAQGVVTGFKGFQLRDYATGRAKWTAPTSYFQPKALIGNVLVGDDSGRLVGISLATGRFAWQGPAPDESKGIRMGSRDDLAPSDKTGAIIADEGWSRVSKEGKTEWQMSPPVGGSPVYADSRRLIVSDGERLLCYVHGSLPDVPKDDAGRKALAQRLVSQYELLDDRERDQVVKLARLTAKPLIAKFADWAIANSEEGPAHKQGLGMLYYVLLRETTERLTTMCTHDDTDALIAAITRVGPENSYRDELVGVLGQKGDPEKSVPLFVEELKGQLHNVRAQGSATLQAVARSKHPIAVNFMISVLKDEKAPSDWRHEAFIHLPGTGGAEGIAAVNSVRKTRGPLDPWETTLMKDGLGRRGVVAEQKDAKGRTWRLVQSGVLGNGSDLFLQPKQGNAWGKPVFVGLFTSSTWTLPEPTTYRGIKVSEFLKSKWIQALPDDAEIRADKDADGLTDLVEERLGTDKSKPDTDADGLGDAVDPCPNAAPRVLGDREKIIATCLEARFFAQDWGTPGVLQIDGVEPFELYGYGRRLLWETPAYKGSLGAMYGTGMNSLGFHAAVEFTESREGKDWVEISADGRKATTTIRRYSGGLNGDGIIATLIKVGDDWFVTDMRMAYVS